MSVRDLSRVITRSPTEIGVFAVASTRSEEHTSELQSQSNLVCRLLLEKTKALHDLEAALAGILDCFRIGRSTLLSRFFHPPSDRTLFASTKAHHPPQSSHPRLDDVRWR